MIISGTRLVGGRYVSPGTVTAGLIMDLDAGDPASYPGISPIWADLSGSGNDAILTGSTPWTSAGNLSYFTFNLGVGYAQGGSILPNNTYTKVVIFQVAGNFLNLISGDASNQHAFWGAGTEFLHAGHNGAWSTIVSPVPTPLGQWVFGAVSFSSADGWRLYLNNSLVATNPDTTQFSANPGQVQIGAYDSSNNLMGDVAVARAYNRVLSDSEVATLFNYYNSRFSF